MFQLPMSRRLAFQAASTWLVTVAGWVVGHAASQGMDHRQIAASVVAVMGSITLAAVAHGRPSRARQNG